MGLLDRLHRMDEDEELEEPQPSEDVAPQVNAVLAVIETFMVGNFDNSFAMTLYVIARRELCQATKEQIDNVVRGTLYAADQLRKFLPPELDAGEVPAEVSEELARQAAIEAQARASGE